MRLRSALRWVLLGAIASCVGLNGFAAERPLWRTKSAPLDETGLRVSIDAAALVRGPTAADSQFDVVLPDGGRYRGQVESTRFDRPDRYVSKGRLLGQPFSDFLFVVQGNVVAGVITPHPSVRIKVAPTPEAGVQRVTGLQIADLPAGGSRRPDFKLLGGSTKGAPVRPRANSSAPVNTPRAATAPTTAVISGAVPDPPLIDVLIVYTQDARIAAGGTVLIQALADLAIEMANDAYLNSGCQQRARLRHTAEVTYAETGSASADLDALTRPADGLMDEAIALRLQYQADLVHLLVIDSDMTDLGWLNSYNTNTFNQTWSFSLSSVDFLEADVVTRGLGSNMGLDHDWQTPSGAVYPYSFGYAFTGNSGNRWATLMSNRGFPRIRYHSNPLIFFDGQPTGQPISAANPAYAALSLDVTATTIEDIVDATITPPPVISSPITASGTMDVAFQYQITATNGPTSFGAAGLPVGLTVNTTTGLISGVPRQTGVYTVDLTASNAGGTGIKVLTLTIDEASDCPLQRLARRLKPLGLLTQRADSIDGERSLAPPARGGLGGGGVQRVPLPSYVSTLGNTLPLTLSPAVGGEGTRLLATARQFRDGVLQTTPEGRAVIDAYYHHGAAGFAVLTAQPDLLRDAAACWLELSPVLATATLHEPLTLQSSQAARIERLLARLEVELPNDARDALRPLRAWLTRHTHLAP